MNPHIKDIQPSAIRVINDKKRPDAIDLGMGQPKLHPESGPFFPAMSWMQRFGCPYSPNAGFPDLRAAIAQHFAYPGLNAPENVCVTIGSQEALYLPIKSLLDPAQDEVLVVTPTFPAYQKLCHLEGVRVKEAPLSPETGFAPDADLVLSCVTEHTRLVALASPCNPTGRVWPEAELRKLAEGLLRLPRPPYLLSDEVYAELYFTPKRPFSPAWVYPHTLVASSLSKSCALTGLRLGWLLAHLADMPALIKAHQLVVSCADTLAQRVAIETFRKPQLLAAHRPHYLAQRQVLLEELVLAGLDFVPPEGSFYCLLKLPEPWTKRSMKFAMKLMDEQNVVTIPSAVFGIEGFLRLTFVSRPEALREGIRRIAQALKPPPT